MSKGLKFFFIAFCVSFFGVFVLNAFQQNLESAFYAQISQPFQQIYEVKIPEKPQKPNLDLQVKAAISVLIDSQGGERVLFKKNSNERLPVASLTKLMTAVIVRENSENYNSSQEYLLDSMLIESNNEAAQTLAEVIGETKFIDLMNAKAKNLGLEKTNFVNPTGLDPENLNYSSTTLSRFNHSTAKNLVILTQDILFRHPIIFEISSLQNKLLQKPDGSSYLAINKNELLGKSASWRTNIVGGKTGYTDQAGGCILLVLKNEKGNYLINVILGTGSPEARFEEMEKLIEWLTGQ